MYEQHNKVSYRRQRIAELLHREISDIVLNRLGDRNIGYTTVLRVTMSQDMKYAKVYVSVMGDKKTRDLTLRALKKASGYVQYELSCRVKLKNLPQVRFHLDQSLDYSEHINHVISELREKGDMGSDEAVEEDIDFDDEDPIDADDE